MSREMSFKTAVRLLNNAAQKRFDGTVQNVGWNFRGRERLPMDIREALKEYRASYRIEGSNGIAGASEMHTETTNLPAADHDTGIQSNDVEMNDSVSITRHQSSTETQITDEITSANDMSTRIADEPHITEDNGCRSTHLFQALETESGARLDGHSWNMNCTSPVGDTFEERAALATDSVLQEPQRCILADELAKGYGLMDNDRQGNNVIDPFLLQDGHNTDSGVESEKDALLASALQSLEGENEITTTAILTTLKALNIDPDTWLVVDPGLFERKSPYLPGLQDTHRYLITVVNVGNHWTAAVIDRDSGQVNIYDPLQQEAAFRSAWSWLQPRLGLVDRHLPMEQNEPPSWLSQKVQSQLQQRDASNCGVYAMVYCIYRLHGLELPQNICPSSWRRAFAGVLAAPNSVKFSRPCQESSLTYVPPRDLATFCKDVKDGKRQAESEQLLQILTLLEETSRQLVANRTALEEADRRHLQRLETHGLRKWDARPGFWPSKAETIINKVLPMIREDYRQADAELKWEQEAANDLGKSYQKKVAGRGK
ncbi:hypothetical protein D0864_01586 [Hortaea werneckii]|uniref:Ubiquitin-like protease family profile domain-containing protein n=1 Tax=Hortaea werneckii TaxID=91943 RepID=A0A3M7H754_HORWE|nr:hypothetical protein D0864_01586 [Hortaea werneckii]